jgi:hypothetical protein
MVCALFRKQERRLSLEEASGDSAWRFKYSVDCAVPVEFAWEFWTDVRNW